MSKSDRTSAAAADALDWAQGLTIDERLNRRSIGDFAGIFARFARFQHVARNDPQLLHSRYECGALQSKAAGRAVGSADLTARIFECLDDLIAINVAKNASDRLPSCRFSGWFLQRQHALLVCLQCWRRHDQLGARRKN